MSNFRQVDRQTGFLLPPSVNEWLPERHLARFVVEVIEGLDLHVLIGSYRGSGSASYHPEMLLGFRSDTGQADGFAGGTRQGANAARR
jgi:transposase